MKVCLTVRLVPTKALPVLLATATPVTKVLVTSTTVYGLLKQEC
jgi:uncharacterized protein YabE (DUF348 family)